MLKIPQEKRAGILTEEKKLDQQKVYSKGPPAKKMKVIPFTSKYDQQMSKQSSDEEEENSATTVKAPYIGVEDKKLEKHTFKKVSSKEPFAKKMKIILLPSKSDQAMFEQSSDKETPTPVVKVPHLNAKVKKLANEFTQLFREMKQTGKDNRGKLCILLDGLRKSGALDEASYEKAHDAIVDICK